VHGVPDAAGPPARLALQTGRLDDRRPPIMPGHALWGPAYELFLDQQQLGDVQRAADHERRMTALCAAWPMAEGQAEPVEAVAVVVALAAPFAPEERILQALAQPGSDPAELGRQIADAPVIASPWDAPRPHFPHIHDPDAEQRAPVIAILDGPRSEKVGEFLETIKQRDRNLADAIVLGASLEMLDLIERLGSDARRAGRTTLAEMFDHDRLMWHERAGMARARQRLEGGHYHWHTDNAPPGCIEAARGEIQRDVDVLLHHPARAAGDEWTAH
jgi:hypothetical protein